MKILLILIFSLVYASLGFAMGDTYSLKKCGYSTEKDGDIRSEKHRDYIKVNCFIDAKNYSKAESIINKMIDKYDDIYLIQKRAEIYVDTGRNRLAIEDCQKVIKIIQDDDTCYLTLGRAFNSNGNHSDAQKVLLFGLKEQGVLFDDDMQKGSGFRLSEWEVKYFLELIDAFSGMSGDYNLKNQDINYLLVGLARNNSSTTLFEGIISFLISRKRNNRARLVINEYCQGIIASQSAFCE